MPIPSQRANFPLPHALTEAVHSQGTMHSFSHSEELASLTSYLGSIPVPYIEVPSSGAAMPKIQASWAESPLCRPFTDKEAGTHRVVHSSCGDSHDVELP
jgi:hypothetical protein